MELFGTINLKKIKEALLLLTLLSASSCATTKETNKEKTNDIEVKYVSDNQNYYEGNLIVKVRNEDGENLLGSKVSVMSKDVVVSEMEISTADVVFYREEKTLSIKVEKQGHKTTTTEHFEMKEGHACEVTVKLNR